MPIMKKDVNLGLLLLIVAALLMFSGFTVYYQTTFKNLSATYQNQIKELEKVTKDLDAKRGLLNETSVQLQLKKQKEEDLSQKFTDVRSERDHLDSDKKKLEVELANTKASLASTSAQLANTQSQLAAQIQLAQDLNQQVLNLKSDVTRLESKVADLQRRITCLKSNGGTSETC